MQRRRQVVEPFFLSNGAIAACVHARRNLTLSMRDAIRLRYTCAAAQTADALLWLLGGWMIFYVLRAAKEKH
jgi:hypothetical protein